jgi:hypothetical protein
MTLLDAAMGLGCAGALVVLTDGRAVFHVYRRWRVGRYLWARPVR